MFAKMSQETKLLISLFLPFFLISCTRHVYLTYARLLHSYGFSSEVTGWILGIYFLAVMISRPLGGWMLENFGIRRTLICGGILSFIGCSLLFFKESLALLLIGRAISGVSFGVYATGIFAYQAICAPENKRGAMFALLAVGGVLSVATVTPLGEWFLINSRNTHYLALGPILSLLCCFVGGKVKEVTTGESRGGGEKNWGTYSELLSLRTFLFLVLTGTLISFIDAIGVKVPLLALEQGLLASLYFTSGAITSVLLRLVGSSALNVLPRVALLAPCGVLMACAIMLMSTFPTSGVFVVSGILFGIGIGAGWPMFHALLADILGPALRPKGTVTALLFFDVGFFVTPLAVGYLLPFLGIGGTFIVIASAAGGGLLLLELFYWLPLYFKGR